MKELKKPPPPPTERQVRAVVVCRPPCAADGLRLGAAAGELEQLDITAPSPAALPAGAADGDLLRDIAVGREACLRMPLYGHGGVAAEQLCMREVAPLLCHLLAGESAAVIAYGQTGSGKSYTMGTEKYDEQQGPAQSSVSAFCCQGVFGLAQESGVKELEVQFAAIEIYREGKDKERLFDLQTLERKRIESFEQQACWRRAATAADLQRQLLDAAFLRNTDRTDGNARSSRSHAIFVTQVQFKRRQQEGGGWQRIKARLMLVDLAGSERASLAQAGSASQKQGSGINVGLLFLGMVINELAERGETKNFNFSVLTRILKPALGGGSNEVTSACNALVLGCISPLTLHAANSRSTLEFLQSAGTVKNVVRADVQMLRQQELTAQVEDLTRQVSRLQLQLAHQRRASATPAAPGDAGAPPPLAGPEGELEPPEQLGGQPEGSSADATATAAAAAAEERAAALEAELASTRKELAVQRDRADAFEAALRRQEHAATAAAAAAAEDAASSAWDASAPAGPAAATTPAASGLAGTPLAAVRPSAALLAASPLLAASIPVADWAADAAAAAAATPPGQLAPLLSLLPGAEEICCERESHMAPEELAALKSKVERLLEGAQVGDDRSQALTFAEACLYSLLAHNKCLGDAVTQAEDAAEDLQAATQQHASIFSQLYQEKAAYMKRTAAAEGGLAEYEAQVEDLRAQLAAAQRELQQQAEAQQGTPGLLGSLGRLMGSARSPGGGTGGAAAPARSRRSSLGASPAASPRASAQGTGSQQQLFASPQHSPSRLGHPPLPGRASQQEAGSAAAAAAASADPGGRRVTVAHVRCSAEQPQAAAAAVEELLGCKQRKAAAQLLAGCAVGESAPAGLIAAVGRSGGEAAPPPAVATASEHLRQAAPEQWHELQPGAGEAPAGPGCKQQLQAGAAGAPADGGAALSSSPELPCPTAGSGGGGDGRGSPHAGALPALAALPEGAADHGQGPAGVADMAQAGSPQQGPGQQHAGQLPPLAQQPKRRQRAEEGAAVRAAAATPTKPRQEAGVQRPPRRPADQQQQRARQEPASGASPRQLQQQGAPVLPGPCISVLVPALPGGGARGRAPRGAASMASHQEFDFYPATGTFTQPGSQERADPLKALAKALPRGEPWQRHVLLAAPTPSQRSGITLERWAARRMLRPGRCHFCCLTKPDPACHHPEPAFGELQLCRHCHEALEPDSWCTSAEWLSADPADPGYQYCCMCGAAGVGSTEALIMCSACEIRGFCTGCLWRFTGDDLAAVLADGATFACPLCRPAPKLHLEPADGSPGAGPEAGQAASRGGGRAGGGAGRGAAQRARLAATPAAPLALRAFPAHAATPEGMRQFVVDLGSSSSEEEGGSSGSLGGCPGSGGSSRGEAWLAPSRQAAAHPRQPAPAAPACDVVPAGTARAASQPATAGAEPACAAALDTLAAQARKRTRLLLKTGDLVSSPDVDGARPALQRRRTAAAQPRKGGGGRAAPQPQPSIGSQLHL